MISFHLYYSSFILFLIIDVAFPLTHLPTQCCISPLSPLLFISNFPSQFPLSPPLTSPHLPLTFLSPHLSSPHSHLILIFSISFLQLFPLTSLPHLPPPVFLIFPLPSLTFPLFCCFPSILPHSSLSFTFLHFPSSSVSSHFSPLLIFFLFSSSSLLLFPSPLFLPSLSFSPTFLVFLPHSLSLAKEMKEW